MSSFGGSTLSTSIRLKLDLSFNLAIPFLGIYHKEIKIMEDICTETLIIGVKTRYQISNYKLVNKVWKSHIVHYYGAI